MSQFNYRAFKIISLRLRIFKLVGISFLCLVSLSSNTSFAKRVYSPNSESTKVNLASYAIEAGELKLDKPSFDWLYQQVVKDNKLSKSEFAEALVKNWLLYQYTKAVSPEILTNSSVDYKVDWYIERQMASYCQIVSKQTAQTSKAIQNQFNQVDKKYLSKEKLESLASYFTLKSQLGYELTAQQSNELKSVLVFDKHETESASILNALVVKNFSLQDLFSRLSVQDKQRLFNKDINIIRREAGVKLAYWNYCNAASIQNIRPMQQALTSLHFRNKLLDHYAISLDQHGDNNSLNRFREMISKESIGQFYRKHKDEFRYLKSANYFSKQFDTQKKAEHFAKNFSERTAKQYTKWREKSSEWIDNLAFSLPLDNLSKPIRTPQGNWVLVYVFDKQYDYHGESSETVRYLATRHLAREKARESYKELIELLWAKQRVSIDV